MRQVIKYLLLLIIFVAVLSNSPRVYADFQFTSDSTTLTPDSEVNAVVNLSLQGQANKNYFLEGAFKKADGQNYFGLTQNNGSWVAYTSSNFTTLPEITTDSQGSWSGNLKLKLDSSSSYFGGDGSYILQIKRFTEGGSSSFSDNQVQITVSGSTQPTSSPSVSPTSTSSPLASSTTSPKLQFSFFNLASNFNSDQSQTVQVVLYSDKPNSDIYLKGAFFKDGSTNYFGKTLVSNSWIKNSASYSSQQKITTDGDGNWAGSIQIMADGEDSGFTGSGNYNFKVAKYTSAGSGPTWTDSQGVFINQISTPSPTANSAALADPSVSPAVLGANTSNDSDNSNSDELTPDSDLALPNLESTKSATPTAIVLTNQKPGNDNWWLVGLGVLVIVIGGIPFVKGVKSREWINTILLQLMKLKKLPRLLPGILSKKMV